MALTQKTLDFLFENRLHDDKAWFNEHKPEYKEYVTEPFSRLINDLQPVMQKIDASIICDPRKISRIYKDARYSHDSVFREDVWYNFSRCVGNDVSPTYYIVLGRGKLEYGCGFYAASSSECALLRELIIKGDSTAKKALKAYAEQDVFALCGDKYKRSRYEGYSEELRDWLERRNFFLSYSTADGGIIFDPELYRRIGEDFLKVKPVYEFFNKVHNAENG